MKDKVRARLSALVATMLIVGAGIWAAQLSRAHLAGERSPLDRVEGPLADVKLLLSGRRAPPPDIVIVAIDDAAIARAGGYPLPRAELARLITRIGAAGPRVVGIDLLLLEPGAAADDAELARALGATPSVIAAAGRFPRTDSGVGGIPQPSAVLWPMPAFEAAAATGLVNVVTDANGTPRHIPLVFRTDRGPTPSFVLRVASLAAGTDPILADGALRLGERSLRLDLAAHLPLRFNGPRGTIQTLSAASVLAGWIPPQTLAGKIVLVGVTATAVGDTFGTAFDPVMPGVEVLATAIGQFVGGDTLVRDAGVRRLDAVIAMALAVAGVSAIVALPLATACAAVLASLAAWLGVTIIAFGQGYWLSAVLPVAAVLPPALVATLVRQWTDSRAARRAKTAEAALKRFQAPALAQRIADDPAFLREPVLQQAGIVFVDLSSFTGLSEKLGPEPTRELLKDFHSLVEEESASRGGLVLAFMGDGGMVAFGIPEPGPDDAAHALEAAWALARRTLAWIAASEATRGVLGVRVGAHIGPVVVSRLGHETHQHITATGDSVNVASRLMEVAKLHGAALAISGDLLDAAGQAAARPGDPAERRSVEIRGRRQPVSVALWRADNLV